MSQLRIASFSSNTVYVRHFSVLSRCVLLLGLSHTTYLVLQANQNSLHRCQMMTRVLALSSSNGGHTYEVVSRLRDNVADFNFQFACPHGERGFVSGPVVVLLLV